MCEMFGLATPFASQNREEYLRNGGKKAAPIKMLKSANHGLIISQCNYTAIIAPYYIWMSTFKRENTYDLIKIIY